MPLDNADNIINASGALSSLDDASGDTAPPGPPSAEATPGGLDPTKWELMRIRMHAPVPALSSPQATELIWQLLRRLPLAHREVVKTGLDSIGIAWDTVYGPTEAEARNVERSDDDFRTHASSKRGDFVRLPIELDGPGGLLAVVALLKAMPVFPGDDDVDISWPGVLDPVVEADWWAP